jgi:hypothetical protein
MIRDHSTPTAPSSFPFQTFTEQNKKASMNSLLTNSPKSFLQTQQALAWHERCNQVESQLIIPMTNELQQRLRDLSNSTVAAA